MPRKSEPSALTTTSYAVLGLLAARPWSPYHLTAQFQRGLNRWWPRAQSKLYEEPKKLVGHGLATAAPQTSGRRRRTVYTITPAGRAELASWLGRPSAPPELHSEGMTKVFLGDYGSKADLVAQLVELRDWARDRVARDAAIAQCYLDGDGPFPERLAILTLTGGYSAELALMTQRWAERSLATVRDWPEDLSELPVDFVRLRQITDLPQSLGLEGIETFYGGRRS